MKRYFGMLAGMMMLLFALLPCLALADSAVVSIEASGNMVAVAWQSTEDALLVVDIIEDDGDGSGKTYASKSAYVSGEIGDGETVFVFDDLPAYFSIESYLISDDTGTGEGTDTQVFTENLYTKDIQTLVRSDGSDYEAQYGDRYVELFIDETGRKSFGVLGEEVTVLRTYDLSCGLDIEKTPPQDVGDPGTITLTATGSVTATDRAWFAALQAAADREGSAVVCIVDDKGKTTLDLRNPDRKEDETVQYLLTYVESAQSSEGGITLITDSELPFPESGSRLLKDWKDDLWKWLQELLKHFDVFRFDNTWNIVDETLSKGDAYRMRYDLKGYVGVYDVFNKQRRVEVSNEFNFKELVITGGRETIEIPLFKVSVPVEGVMIAESIDFIVRVEEGKNVDASMSGSMKQVVNSSGYHGGVTFDHMHFNDVAGWQKLVMEMGPGIIRSAEIWPFKAQIGYDAPMRLELTQGPGNSNEMWHFCGKACMEGVASTRATLNGKLSVDTVFWGVKELDVELIGTKPYFEESFYCSEKFGEFKPGKCPYKGYRLVVSLQDENGKRIESVDFSYSPVPDFAREKSTSSGSSGGYGQLYIPVTGEPVTVQAVYTTPTGTKRTLTQQIVKKAKLEEMVFYLEEDACHLVYDDDGYDDIRYMPKAVTCYAEDIFPITEEIPDKAGYRFAGWSLRSRSDADRQVDYRPGDPFLMTSELYDAGRTVKLYPVWEKDAMLYYKAPPTATNVPDTGVNQTHISAKIPYNGDNQIFAGWKKEGDVLPAYLPGMPNPFYPESGTLEAVFVGPGEINPKVRFDEGIHSKEGMITKVVNMPEDIEEGIVIGVPFYLPAEIPFLIELDFWSVDVPQFFVGWSLIEDSPIPQFFPGMEFVVPLPVEEVTLYAVWVDRPDFFLLSYNANGGSGAPGTGFNSKKISETVPTRAGYAFRGWARSRADADAGRNLLRPGDPNPFYEEKVIDGKTERRYRSGTLYAAWETSSEVYTVSFDANLGTNPPDSITAKKNTGIVIPSRLPNPPGYVKHLHFAGWEDRSVNPHKTYYPGEIYTGSSDVTLYAKWTGDDITIFYDPNGGAGTPTPQTFKLSPPQEKLLHTDVEPVREGYRLLGWSLDRHAEHEQYRSGDLYTGYESAVLYAVWQVNGGQTAVITYDANGGEHAPEPQHAPIGEETELSEQIPIREGYRFAGWSLDRDAEEAQYQPQSRCVFGSDVTLYAVWKPEAGHLFTLTYDANGGDAQSVPPPQTGSAGGQIALSGQIPTRANHIFMGWAEDAMAQSAAYQPGGSYTLERDTTLYAVWAKNPAAYYTLTYDANGGDADSVPAPQTQEKGQTVRLSLQTPERVNHIFMGWARTADAQQDEYQPGDAYTGSQDATLYAVWRRDVHQLYTVHYDANGGDESSVPPDESAFKGETITLSDHIPTRKNRIFAGWALEPGAKTADYQPGAPLTSYSDVTLYAVWEMDPEATITIFYHANGGTGAPDAQTAELEAPVTLSKDEPVRSNCFFRGWALSPQAEQAQFAPGKTYTFSGTVTLYAVWEKDPARMHTISYDANGGTGAPDAQQALEGETLQLSEQRPTLDKHVFKGWALSPEAEHAQFDPGERLVCTQDLTLYAVWERDSQSFYRVVFDANGGVNAPEPQEGDVGQSVRLSDLRPSRTSYVFVGWGASANAALPEHQPGDMLTRDEPGEIRLYAVWTKLPDGYYTVSYDANAGSDPVTGMPRQQHALKGRAINLPVRSPQRPRHGFLGWAESADAQQADYQPGASFTPTANVVLYAVWKEDEDKLYTVTYDANGVEAEVPAPQTGVKGQPIVLSDDAPFHPAYRFIGWATGASADVQYQPGDSYPGDADVTLYAVWDKTEKTYTITYDANGGEGTFEAQSAPIGIPIRLHGQEPVRSGYAFLGWTIDPDAKEGMWKAGELCSFTQDVVLYAAWEAETYTVTYHANGGTGEPQPQTAPTGTAITLSSHKPTRKYYRFMGWAADWNADKAAYLPGASYTGSADTTLYAVWDIDPRMRYTVTYHANGGDASSVPEPLSLPIGEAMMIDLRLPVRENHAFAGWGRSPVSEAPDFMPGQYYNESKDMALYALWTYDGPVDVPETGDSSSLLVWLALLLTGGGGIFLLAWRGARRGR